MREHPILFSAPMVQAILNGNKTMTRRVCKLETNSFDYDDNDKDYGPFLQDKYGDSIPVVQYCPYGQPGDRLWVRETWIKNAPGGITEYFYKADEQPEEVWGQIKAFGYKWKPSIHMPRTASRILLEVVSVRVERVQDISFDDMKKEGCLPPRICGGYVQRLRDEYWIPLWDSINAKRGYGWEVNPWVWVVEFRRVEA